MLENLTTSGGGKLTGAGRLIVHDQHTQGSHLSAEVDVGSEEKTL